MNNNNSPKHEPLAWISTARDQLKSQGLLRVLCDREGPQAAIVRIDGHELINFGSNDYLGLANHPEVRSAAAAAIAEFGWGSGASPLVLGHSALHAQLEQRLADREGTEAALVFPTGYAANLGTITALVGPGDAILSDAKNHASIIDGCRLSGASVVVYSHRSAASVEARLAECDGAGRRLIVTDGLFSMDGDVAPLRELAALATKFDAMLLVDEAHATGVLGEHGRGACEMAGIERCGGLVRTGTLSKALGSLGGFVVGPRALISWLLNRCRSYGFSTAAPAAVCAAALGAIEVEQREPRRRQDLQTAAGQLRADLLAEGWRLGNSESQIIPIIVGEAAAAMELAAELR